MREVLWTQEQQERLFAIVGPDDPLSLLAITQDVALPDAAREVIADIEYPIRVCEPVDMRKLLENQGGEFDPEVARNLHISLMRACELAELVQGLVRSEPFRSLTMEEYSRLQRDSTWLR
ncbi:hypothetical protein IPM09_03715 [Candidatus Saccharibacteria bacterium]|nr:MAG: hypothetical protein IPM09_03715 [Candidatus Saccharibacteria bacterium]